MPSRCSMRKVVPGLLCLVVLAAAGAAIYWNHTVAVMQAAGPHREPVTLEDKPGTSVRAVLAELDARGALAGRGAGGASRGRPAVGVQLRVRGWPQIRTGRYAIAAAASPAESLLQL